MRSPLISTNSSARPRTSAHTSWRVGDRRLPPIGLDQFRVWQRPNRRSAGEPGSWWTTTTPSAVACTSSSMPSAPAERARQSSPACSLRARRGMPRCAMRSGGRGSLEGGQRDSGGECTLCYRWGRSPRTDLNDPPRRTSNLPDRMTDVAEGADEQTDLDLITRWKGGDQRAATLLVERHAGAVGRFASSVGAKGDVQDVVQDTFVRAFASLDSFRGDSSLRTWLFTIARRLLLDLRRSERRRGEHVEVQERTRSRSTIRWIRWSRRRRDSGCTLRWVASRRRSAKCSCCG